LLQAESDKHTLRSELKKAAAARGEIEAEINGHLSIKLCFDAGL